MCDDYSLMKLRNRLAVEGEELVAHRFRSGSIGMVSRSDFCRWITATGAPIGEGGSVVAAAKSGCLQSIKNFFTEFLTFYGFIDTEAGSSKAEPGPVVGIPSEALLRVFDISPNLRRRYHLCSFEDALFTEITPQSGLQRDALCFGNGVIIPLQLLNEGQKVKILRRSWAESIEPAPEPIRVKA